ncbi:MAG: SRPBCC family protein [Phenylobacterium sp.]|nr:SRPBCC family protein [Phenylobacterium sp.]MDO8901002.1 SRPBCC family protein [Phenylobacterium sp.]
MRPAPTAKPRYRPRRVLYHRVHKVLPYGPDQLFDLVGDVDRYPDFVPWITGMRSWNLRSAGEGVDTLDAEAAVGFSVLKERFSTRVRRDATTRTIHVSLISGPFKRLENRWRFHPDPAGTRIEFEIDFEFKSRLLAALLNANFHSAVDRLIGCFEARADQLYGGQAKSA